MNMQVTSNLAFATVFFEDEGKYRCVGTNTQVGDIVRTAVSTYADLTVPRKSLYNVQWTLIDLLPNYMQLDLF